MPNEITIVAIADIHSRDLVLPSIRPDFVFLLGDISWRDVERIDTAYSCPKLGVFGNHDGRDYFDDTNVLNLHGQLVERNGFLFAGFGGALRYSDKPFGQFEEAEAKEFVRHARHVEFFLAHAGPASREMPVDRVHQGFGAFTSYIKEHQPNYFFHGHIHERKKYIIGETKVNSVYGVEVLKIKVGE